MPVYFPSYSNVDMNTIRYAMGLVDNATGPNRYEDANMARFSQLTGRGTALSDYVGVNFYGYVIMYQEEGFRYDGCSGVDHWCYYDATAEDGSYVGSFGGPSTYNTERGNNNGTFLTFGYGYSQTYCRPNSYHNFVSYARTFSNCAAFYVDILRNNGRVAINDFGYAPGDHYTQYLFQSAFQASDTILCRLRPA